jgi:dihydroflavonol-4-reductase
MILVIGATGFLGCHLVQLLLERGQAVRALGRDATVLAEVGAMGAEPRRVAIEDERSLRRAAEGCELVYHVAGFVSHNPRDRARLLEANGESVRRIVDATEPTARIVHTSSIAVFGPVASEDERGDERSTPPDWLERFPYHASKLLGQRYAREAFESGRDVVTANPGFVIGPGDRGGGTTWPMRVYLKGLLRFIVPGGLSYVDARDVATGLVAVAEKGLSGEKYILSSDDGNLSHEAFFAKVGELSGKPRRQLMMPAKTAVRLARLAPWPVAAHEIRPASHWWFFSSERAKRELGYSPRPIDETIADTLEELKAARRPGPQPRRA